MSFVGTCSCLLPRTEYAALAFTCKACCDCGSHSDLVAFRPDVLMEKRALQCLLSIVCVLSTFCVFLSLSLCFLSFAVYACRCPSAFFSSPVFLCVFISLPLSFGFASSLASLALVGISVQRNEHVGAVPSRGVQQCELSLFLQACNFRITCLRISFCRSLSPIPFYLPRCHSFCASPLPLTSSSCPPYFSCILCVHSQRKKYASWLEIDGQLQRGDMKHQES